MSKVFFPLLQRPAGRQQLSGAQWEILTIFGALQNPDFTQILGPLKSLFLVFALQISFLCVKMLSFCSLCGGAHRWFHTLF